jgi:hemerythrin superfamily protein
MKDDTIDALELLMSQHQEVESLIDEIEDADDPDEKHELFIELADNLAAHATIEEKIFYPSVMSEQTRELLVEATEEHLSVKRLLADMMELDVEDEHFDAKLTVLKEQVRHHAHDEEEDMLFPKVRKLLNADELAALGNELMAMFETLLEREPRLQTPSEIAEAAPLMA